MNPSETPEFTVQTLLALRGEKDAVRLITDRLCVKDMGPADHIRTKHEVKAFVDSGDAAMAEKLIDTAQQRRAVARKITEKMAQSRTYRP